MLSNGIGYSCFQRTSSLSEIILGFVMLHIAFQSMRSCCHYCLSRLASDQYAKNISLGLQTSCQRRNRKNPNAQQLPDGYEADREWSSKYLRLCMYGGDVPDIEVYKERDAFSDVIQ